MAFLSRGKLCRYAVNGDSIIGLWVWQGEGSEREDEKK
jgi:hypothetical protein